MRKSAFQAAFPAFTAVVQVGSPSSQLAGRVHLHPICSPHDTDHLPFGHYISTAHASPLGYMLHTLNSFLGHVPFPALLLLKKGWGLRFYLSWPSSSSPRLCFLRPTTSPRSSSNSNSTLFFLPFLPFFLSAESSSVSPADWKISGFIAKSSSNETPSLACSSSSSSSTTFLASFLAWACFSRLGTSSTATGSACATGVTSG